MKEIKFFLQGQVKAAIVCLLLCLAITTQAQNTLKAANKLYDEFWHSKAIEVYEKYLEKHEESYEAVWKLADSYRRNNRYDEAEKWYSKAVAYEEAEPVHKLHYAQILQANGKYSEAVEWYNTYLEEVPEDTRAENQMNASKEYRVFFKDKDRYQVTNQKFNSGHYDFAPQEYNGGLVYSSSRDSEKGVSNISTWTGEQFFDLYHTAGKGDESGGKWSKPKKVGGPVNTQYHEGPVVFSRDSTKVYVTRNNFDNTKGMLGRVGKSEDDIVKLKLYIADIKGEKWVNEKEFKYNSDEYSVGHAAISADGNKLYFVSDMPGGFGGTDIYVSEKLGEDWLEPANAGPRINTEGNEMFPWIAADSTLYFASNGHGGLGGLDIFKIKEDTAGHWGKLRNLGAPMNSPQDDFGFIIMSDDKSRGYLASDRVGGQGSDDIYAYKDNGITLIGIVVDARTDSPICKSTVDMRLAEDIKGRAETECDGMFEFSVVPEKVYGFTACAEGYKCNEDVQASTVGVKEGETVFVKIPLKKDEKVSLEVLVINKQTREPIPASQVSVRSRCDDSEQRGTSNEQGMSYYMADVGCDYPIGATAEGYEPGSTEVTTVGAAANSVVRAVIELVKLVDDRPMVLKDVYYDFDKWNIRVPESEIELFKLVDFLNANPGTTVEIGSHTDARAPFDYNIRLSQRRAQSVVDWLVNHGISKDRLRATGYGETKPRNECKDNVKCTEEEHQQNRRTEFRVIGNNIDIISESKTDIEVDPCVKCPF